MLLQAWNSNTVELLNLFFLKSNNSTVELLNRLLFKEKTVLECINGKVNTITWMLLLKRNLLLPWYRYTTIPHLLIINITKPQTHVSSVCAIETKQDYMEVLSITTILHDIIEKEHTTDGRNHLGNHVTFVSQKAQSYDISTWGNTLECIHVKVTYELLLSVWECPVLMRDSLNHYGTLLQKVWHFIWIIELQPYFKVHVVIRS